MYYALLIGVVSLDDFISIFSSVTRVNYYRKIVLLRKFKLVYEKILLIVARRLVIVVIEADLSDCHGFFPNYKFFKKRSALGS